MTKTGGDKRIVFSHVLEIILVSVNAKIIAISKYMNELI